MRFGLIMPSNVLVLIAVTVFQLRPCVGSRVRTGSGCIGDCFRLTVDAISRLGAVRGAGGGRQPVALDRLEEMKTGRHFPGARKSPAVIVFDWDDTLLPTSYLNGRYGLQGRLTQADQDLLVQVVDAATALLKQAARIGHVVIITNAMEGWIEYSCNRWAPGLMAVVGQLPRISARTLYEQKCISMGEVDAVGSCWKRLAFQAYKANQLKDVMIDQIISAGDGSAEFFAAGELQKFVRSTPAWKSKQKDAFKGVQDLRGALGGWVDESSVKALAAVQRPSISMPTLKTIKFQERVRPVELVKELELVSKKFFSIAANPNDLKIGLERKSDAQQAAEQTQKKTGADEHA